MPLGVSFESNGCQFPLSLITLFCWPQAPQNIEDNPEGMTLVMLIDSYFSTW